MKFVVFVGFQGFGIYCGLYMTISQFKLTSFRVLKWSHVTWLPGLSNSAPTPQIPSVVHDLHCDTSFFLEVWIELGLLILLPADWLLCH